MTSSDLAVTVKILPWVAMITKLQIWFFMMLGYREFTEGGTVKSFQRKGKVYVYFVPVVPHDKNP